MPHKTFSFSVDPGEHPLLFKRLEELGLEYGQRTAWIVTALNRQLGSVPGARPDSSLRAVLAQLDRIEAHLQNGGFSNNAPADLEDESAALPADVLENLAALAL